VRFILNYHFNFQRKALYLQHNIRAVLGQIVTADNYNIDNIDNEIMVVDLFSENISNQILVDLKKIEANQLQKVKFFGRSDYQIFKTSLKIVNKDKEYYIDNFDSIFIAKLNL